MDKKKHFRVGMYTTVVSVVAVVLVVFINLFVSSLPSTSTKIDLTAQSYYTIEEQSIQIAESVDHEVDIYLLAQNGSEDSVILEFLNRYAAVNSNIVVKTKDYAVYPTFASNYTDETISDNSVLVVDETTGRSMYIDYDEIYVTEITGIDYTTYEYTYEYSFAAETEVTTALNYVTSQDLPTVYQLSGHGSETLSSTLQTELASDNVSLEDLNLLSEGAIPEDCATLLIYNPTSDLSEYEAGIILEYLEAGGRALIVTDIDYYTEDSYPNLASILNYYGVTTTDGVVVETSQGYYYQYNTYLLPEVSYSHEISSPIAGSYYILCIYSQGIEISEDLRDTLSVTSLIDSTDDSYAKVITESTTSYEQTSDDEAGPFSLGVAISETIGDDDTASDTDASDTDADDDDTEDEDTVETRLVYYSGAYFLDDSVNNIVSGANHDLFLNSVGWLTEREETISVRAKTIEEEYLVVTALQATIWEIILIGLVPLIVIIIGISIVVKRSRK
ncbi:MAG: GldG family protein [Lachnospiraceae bacterium]|nr:GldG family protein [Lachnospiraceae bacterium]